MDLNKLNINISTDPNVLSDIQYRLDNRYWITYSQGVAIRMMQYMRLHGISKQRLAYLSGILLEDINVAVTGKYDFKISELIKLESIIGNDTN